MLKLLSLSHNYRLMEWLRRVGGGFVNDAVWRKILSDHPQIIDVCLRGNEAMLEIARREHPKLDDAIKRFGLPSPELLDKLTRGGQTSFNRSIPFIEADSLTPDQLGSFLSDGFVVVRDAVPMTLITDARRFINASIGRGTVDRSIPGLVGVAGSAAAAPALLSLFHGKGSRVPTVAQNLLGKGRVRAPMWAQVAVRFPSPCGSAAEDKRRLAVGGRAWHVDGINEGKHSHFSLLAGICLSDASAPGSGGLGVHPGAHWSLQSKLKHSVDTRGSEWKKDFQGQGKPDLGDPIEVLLRAGDVVLAHQKLPHLGMPNVSADPRYAVYFRLEHVNQEGLSDACLDNMILPFEGLKAFSEQ